MPLPYRQGLFCECVDRWQCVLVLYAREKSILLPLDVLESRRVNISRTCYPQRIWHLYITTTDHLRTVKKKHICWENERWLEQVFKRNFNFRVMMKDTIRPFAKKKINIKSLLDVLDFVSRLLRHCYIALPYIDLHNINPFLCSHHSNNSASVLLSAIYFLLLRALSQHRA